jgi:hypothetical protein
MLDGKLKKKDITGNFESTNQIISSIHNPFTLCNIEYSIYLGTYDGILLIYLLTRIFSIEYTYIRYLLGKPGNNMRHIEINYRNRELARGGVKSVSANNSYKFKNFLNSTSAEINIYTHTLFYAEFPNKNLINFINHLDNFPLLSYKHIIYYKSRKIYRICQRKEYFNKKGLLKILNIWATGR